MTDTASTTPVVCRGCARPHGLGAGDYCYRCWREGKAVPAATTSAPPDPARVCQECGLPTVMYGPLCNPRGLPYCVACLDVKEPGYLSRFTLRRTR